MQPSINLSPSLSLSIPQPNHHQQPDQPQPPIHPPTQPPIQPPIQLQQPNQDQLFYYSPAPPLSQILNPIPNQIQNTNQNQSQSQSQSQSQIPNQNQNQNQIPKSPSSALFVGSTHSPSPSASSPAPDPLTTLSRDLIHYSLAHAAPNITALAPFGAPPLFNSHAPNLRPIHFNLTNSRFIPLSSSSSSHPAPAILQPGSFNPSYPHLSQNQPFVGAAPQLKQKPSLSIINPQDQYSGPFSPPSRPPPGPPTATSIRSASPKPAQTPSAISALSPDQDRDRDRGRGRDQERDRGREQHPHLRQHQLPPNTALKLTSQPLYSPTHTVFDQHLPYSIDQPGHFSAPLSLKNIPLHHNQDQGLSYPSPFSPSHPGSLPKTLRRKGVSAAPLSPPLATQPNSTPNPNSNPTPSQLQHQNQKQNPNPNPVKSRSRTTQSKPASPSGLRLAAQPPSTLPPPLSPDQVPLPPSSYSTQSCSLSGGFAHPSIKSSPMPLDSLLASAHNHPEQAPPKRPRGRSTVPERSSDRLGVLSPDHSRLGYFDIHPAAFSVPPNPINQSPRLLHSPPAGPPPGHAPRPTLDTQFQAQRPTSLLPDLDRTYRAFRTALGHANRQAALDAKDALSSLLDRSALMLTQPTPQLALAQTTLLPLDTPAMGYPTPASFLGLPTATSSAEPGSGSLSTPIVPPAAPRLERKRSRERVQTDAVGQKAARPDEAGHSSAGLVSRRASLVGLSAALGPPAETTPDGGGTLANTGLMSPSSTTELPPATPASYVPGSGYGAFGAPQGMQAHPGPQTAGGYVSFPTPLMTPHEHGGEPAAMATRAKLMGPAPTSSVSSPVGGERQTVLPGDERGMVGMESGEAGEREGTFEWVECEQKAFVAMPAGKGFGTPPHHGSGEDEGQAKAKAKAEEDVGWEAVDSGSQWRSRAGTPEMGGRPGAGLGDNGCESSADTSHSLGKPSSIDMNSCQTGQASSYQQSQPPPQQQQIQRVASPPVNKQMGAASAGVSAELAAQFEPIFTNWLGRLCSDLDMKDSKGEPIHQTLMARKMQRLEESADFRPFKFRIQAFTNSFFEELVRCGFSEKELPMKKVRQYLWSQSCISRFNEEGKKAKSKGNHVWHIEAQKIMNGQWNFLHFQRKIIGTPPGEAYVGVKWAWAAKVWDPQCSAQNIKAVFSSADLPGWLHWKDNVLSGVAGPDELGREYEIVAVATTSHNSRRYSLELPFKISVRPREELDQIIMDRQAEEASGSSQLDSMAASMTDVHGGLMSSSEQPSTDSTPKLSPNLSGFAPSSGVGLEALSAGLVGPGGRFGAQDGFPGLARTDSNESVSISSPSLEDLPMQSPDQLLAESGLMSGFAAAMKESSLDYEQPSGPPAGLNPATAAAVADALCKLADVQPAAPTAPDLQPIELAAHPLGINLGPQMALNPAGQQSLLGGEGRPELGLMIPSNPVVGGLMSSALGPESGTGTGPNTSTSASTGPGTGGMNSGSSGVGILGQMMSGSELMPSMNEVEAMDLSNALGNPSPELMVPAAAASEGALPSAAALLEEVVQIQEAHHAVAMHEARLQTVRENLMSADQGVSDTAGKMIRQAIESADPAARQFAADVLGPMATGTGEPVEGAQCEEVEVGGGGEHRFEGDGSASGEGRHGRLAADGSGGYSRRMSNAGIDHHHQVHHHHYHHHHDATAAAGISSSTVTVTGPGPGPGSGGGGGGIG